LSFNKQLEEYKKQTVNGATPVQLVIMLYDGALRFMEKGKSAVIRKDYNEQNQYLQKAQNIIIELMSCLDMERGGEISANLLSLYSYVLQQLIDANVKDLTEPIDQSMTVLSELRESWRAIESQLKANRMGETIAA